VQLAILAGFVLFLLAGAGVAWMVLSDSGNASPDPSDAQTAAGRPRADHTPGTVNPTPVPVGSTTEPPNGSNREPKNESAGESDRTHEPINDTSTNPQKPPPPASPAGPTGPQALHVGSSGNVIMVTDRRTHKEIWRKNATGPVVFLGFAPDGKTVISRDQNGETCTWDAATGNLLKREQPKAKPKPDPAITKKPPPKTETPVPKAEKVLDPEELRASLVKVKEIDFYPVVYKLRNAAIEASVTGKDFATDQQLRQLYELVSPPKFLAKVNGVLLKKAGEEGLPLVPKAKVRMTLQAARTMDAMSKQLRVQGFVSIPGAAPAPLVTPGGVPGVPKKGPGAVIKASAHATELENWCKENHIERYEGALNTFLQMLQIEDDPTRMVLVEEVGKCKTAVGTEILANRAVFDLSPDVRKASVELLRKRKPETYRSLLLQKFRYPWAPAADHAAEALVSLTDKNAIPKLAELLAQPDPSLPVFDDKKKTGVVKELVRINHMRNCFLCHAVSRVATQLVRGAVPEPGAALPLPEMYYNSARADFVSATVTFLRQDFSVAQPVKNAAPWPSMQRYDYMVRTRKATDAEMAKLRDTPSGSYPQRNAVLSALRKLSGRDLGTSTVAWKKYASELANKPKAKGDPKDKPKAKGDPKPPEKKPGS
jgi:hypothetical protein